MGVASEQTKFEKTILDEIFFDCHLNQKHVDERPIDYTFVWRLRHNFSTSADLGTILFHPK